MIETREWKAFEAGYQAVREWLNDVPAEAWDGPSVLYGWTVSDLAAHFRVIARSTAVIHATNTPPISVGEYITRYAGDEAIDDFTHNALGGVRRQVTDVRQAMSAELEQARSTVAGLAEDDVVTAGRGPLRLADYLRTRVIEVAVHADDLARSVPAVEPPALPSPTRRLAVRSLLDVLTQKAPGRSVEVRVPPYAAVQCVAGPRHSRGTPSNVVEMNPEVWLRLATGRVAWVDAVAAGTVSASGSRADLTSLLPLM